MAKVFRLHEGQDGSGWFTSNPPTKEQLKDIKTSGIEVATSIPSPFARIDLVKSAFQWVADNGTEGNTAQHKLVSNALDVGQLFFSYPNYKNQIKIVSWDPSNRFADLRNSINQQHSLFAQTLNIFWDQDAHVYNFDKVNRLYFILNNINNQVIGGTSPATLFFASPDVNIAMNGLTIADGKHLFFQDRFTSLINRDKSFIEYLYTLSKQPNFPDYFPELFSYLDVCKGNLNNSLQSKIAQLKTEDLASYEVCSVLNNHNDSCEVLGIKLGVQRPQIDRIEKESDFVIKPDYSTPGLKPLVLPNTTFNNEWTYTVDGINWDRNNVIPEKNSQDLGSYKLPIQGDPYEWLSIGNFLEDKIIELPYFIDDQKFIVAGSDKYLLPLTPTFFKYYEPSNVGSMVKMEPLAGGGLEVILEVPVKKGAITFRKTYHSDNIIKLGIHLAILPFLRSEDIDIDYTIGIQDTRANKRNPLNIEIFEKGKSSILTDHVVRRPDDDQSLIKSLYFKSKSFDCIRIGTNDYSGFIVPKMKLCFANQEVSFAIDFGTTNTHIEYKHESNAERSLDSNPTSSLWQSLLNRTKQNSPLEIRNNAEFEREIVPYEFGDSLAYKFPFRTALIHNKDINSNQPFEVFRHVNNYFLLEKVFYTQSFKLHTKLKWGNYTNPLDKKLVQSYIDYLLYLVYYKTLLLNGNPQEAKVTWFYPVSMDSYELGIFSEAWQNSYQRIFKVDNFENINLIPESIAPYLYYRTQFPGLSLSIDIGGGSSDIAVFEKVKDSPEFISSIKFAGNAIFGDGYPKSALSANSDMNGYVRSFRKSAEVAIESMKSNNAPNIKEIFDDIINKRKDSADFSSFLFSLENESGIDLNYTDLLRQDRYLKLPILIFYGAIIYYSANLLKKKGITKIPKNILLSGTASKSVKVLDPAINFPNISNLLTFIFKKVMDIDGGDIIIALADNPKEISCKGALKAGINDNIVNSEIAYWLGGKDNTQETSFWNVALNPKTDIINTPLYADIDERSKGFIEASINDFFDLLDIYFSNKNIESDFGIDRKAYAKFKEVRSKNIIEYLESGIKAFHKSADKHIEETLFFYPLIGMMNSLAFNLKTD